jgi:uncharacterized protein (TIGR00369 family)
MTRALADRLEAVPYARALGVRVESAGAERVRLRIPYKDENSNPGRALHGGVAASSIGIAGALASEAGFAVDGPAEATTLDLTVSYLAAAIGEDVVVDGTVLRRGKELAYVDIAVRTDAGKAIAKGLVTHRVVAAGRPEAAARQLAVAPGLEDEGPGPVPKLAAAIAATPFIARLGLRYTAMDGGRARIEMPCKADNQDADGALHEGAVAALLDTTGAMASWSVTGLDLRYKASTVGIHVSHHARVPGGDAVAVARTLRRNDEIFLNAVVVRAARSQTELATGSVTNPIVVTA